MDEEAVFTKAVGIQSAEDRAAFLEGACGDDAELRSSVEHLLQLHDESGEFLERSAIEGRETELLESVVAGRHEPTEAARDPAKSLNDFPLDFLKPSEQPGSLGRLEQYEVLEVVGRGGMGIVLKAHDTKLNRTVAVKVLAPELASNPTARKRFLREAQAAAAVSHDHVVTIFAVEESETSGHGRLPYLVMELIDGLSLQQKIDQEGHLELKEVLRIGRQVAAGLSAAHEQGLIHRDVKPANILLQNSVQRVKITDFGLARAADDVGMTRTGEVTGTPQFMSPEQAQGQPVDVRSDLFSLGSVLYAMCTGRSPFRADTTMASLRRVCDDTPRPIREINPDVPDWLAEIIDRLLEKKPHDRFQTAAEVAELLGQHLAHLQNPQLTPLPAATSTRPRKHSSRHKLLHRWAIAAAILIAVFTLATITEATGVTHFATAVIRIAQGEGMLVIEVDDPSVQISLDGEELSIRGAGFSEFKLRPGEYRVKATKDGRVVKQELVTISRGGREVVKVTLEQPSTPRSARATSGDYRSIPEGAITEVRRFEGHGGHIWDLCFTSDGSELVSAAEDNTVRLWNVANGGEIRKVLANEGSARCIALLPDNRGIAGMWGGDVKLFSLEGGGVLKKLQIHDRDVVQMAVTSDGKRVLTGGYDGTARFWELESGRELARYDCDRLPWVNVAIAPNERGALVGQSSTLIHWNLESGEVGRDLSVAELYVMSLKFSPNGRYAVAGSTKGPIYAWEIATGKTIGTFKGHNDRVGSLAFSPDGRFLYSACLDKTLRVWDFHNLREVARVETETHCVNRLAVSPDGRYVATGGGSYLTPDFKSKTDGDYAIRLWRLPESVWPKTDVENQLTEVRRFESHSKLVAKDALAFTPDGRFVVSSHPGLPAVLLWDAATGKKLRALDGADRPDGLSVAVSPDGRRVAVGYGARGGNMICTWATQDWAPEIECTGHTGGVVALQFSPTGKQLASAGQDGTVRLWDADTGEALHQWKLADLGVYSVTYSPDGRYLVAPAARSVVLLDLESYEKIRDVQADGTIFSVRFSPDGRLIAAAGLGQSVYVWETETGKQVARFSQKDGGFADLEFCGNDHVVSSGGDGAVRLWHIPSGRLVGVLRRYESLAPQGWPVLAVSPDGEHLLTGVDATSAVAVPDAEKAFRLWRLPESVWPAYTSKPLGALTLAHRFAGHDNGTKGIFFSTDGRELITAGGDRLFRVWDRSTGKLLRSFDVGFPAEGAAALPSGNRAVVFGHGLQVVDLQTGAVLREFQGHEGHVNRIAVSPDGRRLLSGGYDRSVRVWEIETGKQLQQCDVSGTCWGLAFSPDGESALLVDQMTILHWNPETGETIRRLREDAHPSIRCVTFSPDGKLAFAGDAQGVIRSWNLETGDASGTLTGHADCVASLDFSADGRFLLSGSLDGTMRVWDWGARREIARVHTTGHSTNHAVFSPDGQSAASSGGWYVDADGKFAVDRDSPTHLWRLLESVWSEPSSATQRHDVPAIMESRLLAKHEETVCSVAFSPDGRLAAAAGGEQKEDGKYVPGTDFDIRLWNVESGEQVHRLSGHTSSVYCLAFSPDGRYVLSGSRDTSVRLWDVATGKEIRSFQGHTNIVQCVAFSPDSRFALSGGHDGRLIMWSVEDGRQLWEQQVDMGLVYEHVWCVAFSPDGSTAVSGHGNVLDPGSVEDEGGHLRLWNAETGEEIRRLEGHTRAPRGVAFTPDGKRVVSAGHDWTIRTWDVASGKEVGRIDHDNFFTSLALTPDGNHVLTAGPTSKRVGRNGPILWNLRTGKPTHVLSEDPRVFVHGVAVSPDGRLALSGSWDGTVRLWKMPDLNAFVLLNRDGAEQAEFDTLAEAVAGSSAGEIIEIRGNGPFTIDPIEIDHPLAIRAGDGFRPVIVGARPADDWQLLLARDSLVLEGLDIRSSDAENAPGWSHVIKAQGALGVSNCRFQHDAEKGTSLRADADCYLRNCELLSSVAWWTPVGGKCVVQNCVSVDTFSIQLTDVTNTSLELTRNTFRAPVPLSFLPRKVPEKALNDPAAKGVRIHASCNILDAGGNACSFNLGSEFLERTYDIAEAEALLQNVVAWSEQQNLHSAESALLGTRGADGKLLECDSGKDLESWNRFWGLIDTGSFQGIVSYQGGDLWWNARKNPEQLTPEDFRLTPDSAGYQAGPDGKDLGADVDLVGPGEACERWKQTPEYQQWLKQTRTLMTEAEKENEETQSLSE